jgi:hypothetical protein
MVTNCDGTRVTRTDVGTIMITRVEADLPGCIGKQNNTSLIVSTGATETPSDSSQTGNTIQNNVNTTQEEKVEVTLEKPKAKILSEVVNCDGTWVTRYTDGRALLTRGEKNQDGCITRNTGTGAKFDPTRGPALDIRSTDIVNYRTHQMRENGIRYVNPIRSVKMRNTPSMQSRVVSYLMRNDAVLTDKSDTGWVQSQWANILVTDTGSNIVVADTQGKAKGYIASRYLRIPTASDLVRIEQADQAYWSDVARVNVDHRVNVRAHPWYGAKILFVLSDETPLYIVSTVDNWSEVISDDRSIRGYIRSDYIRVEKYQRTDR